MITNKTIWSRRNSSIPPLGAALLADSPSCCRPRCSPTNKCHPLCEQFGWHLSGGGAPDARRHPPPRRYSLIADGVASDEPRYWELLCAFRDITGVPALLNTSFHSRAEPIVDSIEDAVVVFLPTDFDSLVVGDFVVQKHTPSRADRLALRLSLPRYVRLQQTRRFVGQEGMAASCQICTTYDAKLGVSVSRPLFELLMGLEGERALSELLPNAGEAGDAAAEEALLSELDKLWSQRLVRLRGGA